MIERSELVVAFVAPVGVRLRDLIDHTAEYFQKFKYNPVEIRLSGLFERCVGYVAPASKNEDERILHGQALGRRFREGMNDAGAVALAAVAAIREERAKLSGSPDKPADSTVFFLNQLKHPREVKLLRTIYGSNVVLIAAHATKRTREQTLIHQIATKESRTVHVDDSAKANNIIRIDEEEPAAIGADELGQNTRNTYPLADIFINMERAKGEQEIDRFIDLLFGHPFHSPQPDEVAMYIAQSTGLRSSDDSRQVGAVIVNVKQDGRGRTSNVDVIANGMNEVPMRGGGFYWDSPRESPDGRDQWLIAYRNDDRALRVKNDVLGELLDVLRSENWLAESITAKQTPVLLKELIPGKLKGTQFMNISEFQRQVHAEMAALIDSARRGVSVDGHTMYVTTFPCHNCAKHIIAAGLKRVFYLEPYPKSRAQMLHDEEIELEYDDKALAAIDNKASLPKVHFSPYTGIAPRQYQRLFSMLGRGKKNDQYSLKEWDLNRASLAPQHLVRNSHVSYTLSERQELATLHEDKFLWDRRAVCP
jgi:cytidine deaminase